MSAPQDSHKVRLGLPPDPGFATLTAANGITGSSDHASSASNSRPPAPESLGERPKDLQSGVHGALASFRAKARDTAGRSHCWSGARPGRRLSGLSTTRTLGCRTSPGQRSTPPFPLSALDQPPPGRPRRLGALSGNPQEGRLGSGLQHPKPWSAGPHFDNEVHGTYNLAWDPGSGTPAGEAVLLATRARSGANRARAACRESAERRVLSGGAAGPVIAAALARISSWGDDFASPRTSYRARGQPDQEGSA